MWAGQTLVLVFFRVLSVRQRCHLISLDYDAANETNSGPGKKIMPLIRSYQDLDRGKRFNKSNMEVAGVPVFFMKYRWPGVLSPHKDPEGKFSTFQQFTSQTPTPNPQFLLRQNLQNGILSYRDQWQLKSGITDLHIKETAIFHSSNESILSVPYSS